MAKFFNKFKKPCFKPIFAPFSQHWVKKKLFSKNLVLSCTISYGFLATCQNLGKTNDTIPRKRKERRTDGRTDRMTDRPYFTGALPINSKRLTVILKGLISIFVPYTMIYTHIRTFMKNVSHILKDIYIYIYIYIYI